MVDAAVGASDLEVSVNSRPEKRQRAYVMTASTSNNHDSSDSASVFKRKLQYHKRRPNDMNRMDDLNNVIDASTAPADSNGNKLLYPINYTFNVGTDETFRGPVYGIHGYDGCLLLPQALSPQVQQTLAYQAVTEYCCDPHATNTGKSEDQMWEIWKRLQQVEATSPKKGQHHTNSTKSKLSWATMGYHYNWTERSYNKKNKSPMPSLVQRVATKFAKLAIGIQQQQADSASKPNNDNNNNNNNNNLHCFTPSAAIINYYNVKSTMGGHADDLEYTFDKPIVSMSLGLPAVFVLGGTTVHDPATAILLRPGDALVMGGASRLAMHAMARLLPHAAAVSLPKSRITPPDDDNADDFFEDESIIPSADEAAFLQTYLQYHRININVRQVYPDGEDED
jgi:alkylated DNA repair protein alkB homolog 1